MNKLTSILIMTPDRVVALFAYIKKSTNDTKLPSFMAFGFRYNPNPDHGLDIAATRSEREHVKYNITLQKTHDIHNFKELGRCLNIRN